MHLCYLDESGTPDVPGNTSHYILAGLAIPIWNWRDCEREIGIIRKKFGLENYEIHTAWMLRAYLEQSKIPGFSSFSHFDRRQKVEAYRNTELLRLQKHPNHKAYQQAKKTYRHTAAYVHLTFEERRAFIKEVAKCVSNWGFARLFAECIDKINFQSLNLVRPTKEQRNIDEQALEQVVSRFENHLRIINTTLPKASHAILIHDNNETVCKKHTELMKKFHLSGTLWTNVKQTDEYEYRLRESVRATIESRERTRRVLEARVRQFDAVPAWRRAAGAWKWRRVPRSWRCARTWHSAAAGSSGSPPSSRSSARCACWSAGMPS